MPSLNGVRLSALCGLAAVLAALPIQAATVTTLLAPFTGDPASVRLILDDGVDPGRVRFTVEVVADPNVADIRGVFLHIADELLLDHLSVIDGADVTGSQFAPNGVINLGNGANLEGGGSPCPCDIGLLIGTPGIGKDDIQSTVFTLKHSDPNRPLSIFDFHEQLVGVRVNSVGLAGGAREGSSKLVGQVLVPEPQSVLLLAAGLGALGARRRRAPA